MFPLMARTDVRVGRTPSAQSAGEPSKPLIAATVAYAASAGIGLALGLLAPNPAVFVALAVLAGIQALGLIAKEWHRVGDPLTPIGVLGMTSLLLFCLRPIAIWRTGTTTAGAAADSRPFQGVTVAAGTAALGEVALFLGICGALVTLHAAFRPALPRSPSGPFGMSLRRARWVLVAALAVCVAMSGMLVVTSGGLTAHLRGLSLRSSFLGGRFALTLGYVPLGVGLSAYLLARRLNHARRQWDALAIVGIVVLIGATVLTGGRGPLLLGAILPLLVLLQTGPKAWRGSVLLGAGLVLAIGAMVMSILLRENAYTSGEAVRALVSDPFGTLLTRVTDGVEARPFDSLVLLNEVALQGRLVPQLGATYLAVLTWFVPGSLIAKTGGANTWFTMNYLPRYYYPDRIETSISVVGEGFANFGYVGVALAAVCLTLVAIWLGTLRAHPSKPQTLYLVMLTPMFFSMVRGDAYQNVSLAIMILTLCALTLLFVRERPGLGNARPAEASADA